MVDGALERGSKVVLKDQIAVLEDQIAAENAQEKLSKISDLQHDRNLLHKEVSTLTPKPITSTGRLTSPRAALQFWPRGLLTIRRPAMSSFVRTLPRTLPPPPHTLKRYVPHQVGILNHAGENRLAAFYRLEAANTALQEQLACANDVVRAKVMAITALDARVLELVEYGTATDKICLEVEPLPHLGLEVLHPLSLGTSLIRNSPPHRTTVGP
ncbi:hypothetical protein T484DRAFT_1946897 [Baffinella frigidus]|nr:hypothetical protein T484DRAFT_1946897 [Cryptophyta sp. CCMP2293]